MKASRAFLQAAIIIFFLLIVAEGVAASFPNCAADTNNGRWDIEGTETISANQTCAYINITGSGELRIDSSVNNESILISADNITISADAEITATGLGYLNTSGPGGAGSSNNQGGGGAGHGGDGQNARVGVNGFGGTRYGSALEPRTLGSGGGDADGRGGYGGGAIVINVTNELWINGTITTNGTVGTNIGADEPGGGAGGSIYIDATHLLGVGSLHANGADGVTGGDDGGGGAGGRIAVYYNTTDISFAKSSVTPGLLGGSTTSRAEPGTLIFIDKDDNNVAIKEGFEFQLDTVAYQNMTLIAALLRINKTVEVNATGFNTTGAPVNFTCYEENRDFYLNTNNSINLDNFTIDKLGIGVGCKDIIISRSINRDIVRIEDAEINANASLVLNITDDDLVLVNTKIYANINLTVTNFTLDADSMIIADEKGYPGGVGEGTAATNINQGAGGGGHGGDGGDPTSASGSDGGKHYGSAVEPRTYGSGGGISDGDGGFGGGAIFLNVTNTFWLNGTITTNGTKGKDVGADEPGGGAGGSIYIDATHLLGVGSLHANGADGVTGGDDGGGGAGGRIAVYYNTTDINFSTATVVGGLRGGSSNVRGGLGTIVYIDKDDDNYHIVDGFEVQEPIVAQNMTFENAMVRLNTSLEWNVSSIDLGDAIVNISCYQTGDDITINIEENVGLNRLSFGTAGLNTFQCGEVVMHRTQRSNVTVQNALIEANTTLIFNISDDLSLVNTTLKGNLNLTIPNLTIDQNSVIDAEEKGFYSSTGPGAGGTDANDGGSGAGHGGFGTKGINGGSPLGGGSYGSALEPRTLGSGGGSGDGEGGVGGGAIFLNITDTFWLNGTIAANGSVGLDVGTGDESGAGAGGSIYIDTDSFLGIGTLHANGADGYTGTDDGGGGAGGRVAVYYNTADINFTASTVKGGLRGDGGAVADNGTMIFIDKDDNNAEIVARFEFQNDQYNFTNLTLSDTGAVVVSNAQAEINVSNLFNTNTDTLQIECINQSNDIILRSENNLDISNLNISKIHSRKFFCGNIFFHRTQDRTNVSIKDAYINASKTILLNVTDTTLIFNNSVMQGNMNITAATVVIDNTSILTAVRKGFTWGEGSGQGNSAADSGGGGAHASTGGSSSQSAAGGSTTYGNNVTPTTYGSAGGNATNSGQFADGGGAIFIEATSELHIEGVINVSGIGSGASGDAAGGAAGGSIWLITNRLYGFGTIEANGGTPPDLTQDGGGGSGGYIAVNYSDNQTTSDFTAVAVGGFGPGSATDGGAGIVEFIVEDRATPRVTDPLFNVTQVGVSTGVSVSSTFLDEAATTGNMFFEWFINDSSVFTQNFTGVGNNTATVSVLSESFGLDDTINATVFASNGTDNSAVKRTGGVVVENVNPTSGVPIINTTSGNNYSADNISAFDVDTNDPEGDTVYNIYTWYQNDQPVVATYFPFNPDSDNSATQDYSGHQRNGTINDAIFNETGGFDGSGAYNFNGTTAYIDTQIDLDQSTGGPGATFMAWVYPTSTSSGRHHVISTDNGGFDWSLLREAGTWYVFTGSGSSSTTKSVDTNTWQHVAAVFDPSNNTVRFYKNGEEREITTLSFDTGDNDIDVGRNPSASEYFEGVFDEVRIYEIPLTKDEIVAIYNNQSDIILGSRIAEGDTWNVSITPTTTSGRGAIQTSQAVTISNNVELINLEFNTSTVTPNTGAGVSATYQDTLARNASIFFEWLRNDSSVFTQNLTDIPNGTLVNSSLSSALFIPGDTITAQVRANNGVIETPISSVEKLVANEAPIHARPILNASADGNTTLENLTAYNVSTGHSAGSVEVKNIINWFKDANIEIVNMPFDGHAGNEASVAKDYAGTQNNGTVTGATWSNETGFDGKGAYTFDGNGDRVVIANTNQINTFNVVDRTIALWFKPNNVTRRQILYEEGGGTHGMSIYIDTGSVYVAAWQNSGNGLGSWINTTQTIEIDTWYHVALVLVNGTTSNTSETFFGYLDGVEFARADGRQIDSHSGDIVIGDSGSARFHDGSTTITTVDYDGVIDEFMLANTAYTHEQIALLASNRSDIMHSSMTTPEESYNVSYTPNDNSIDGTTLTSTAILVGPNDAPNMTAFQFNLTDISRSTGIRVNTTYFDNNSHIGNVYFAWYRNGSEVFTQNFSHVRQNTLLNSTLDATAYLRGDLINVTAYADDFFDTGPTINSSTLTVQNVLPNVTALVLNRSNITENSGIAANATFYDGDGDGGTLFFEWFRNGSSVKTQNISVAGDGIMKQSTLAPSTYIIGDLINVTVYAGDNTENSGKLETAALTVQTEALPVSIDIANTTTVTASLATIRQNDVVSFNATFNVTGDINATGLNVTLTVDNQYVTGTNITIVNGTSQEVELNWTAENGVHNIRINADANNTFGESFEDNNNATLAITVYNISRMLLTNPLNQTEIIRGNDSVSLPAEDTLKKVTNLTTVEARVINKFETDVGVNSNCTFYFDDTLLGWNQTNTTGHCTWTFDHAIYEQDLHNITVNYTNLNTSSYVADSVAELIQNTSVIDLSVVQVDLDPDNTRTGGVYYEGDIAIINVTVTKNGTAYNPDKLHVRVKNPGAECNGAGGLIDVDTYPGSIRQISDGLFQSYTVLDDDVDIHWCVTVNGSSETFIASASHSDREVVDVASEGNFTVINTSSSGDDGVFDDVNITFKKTGGRYNIFDRNFSEGDAGERRKIPIDEEYDVLFRYEDTQEQLNISGINISQANRSLHFNFLTSYDGEVPNNFTNLSSIMAFNSSGFSFQNANISIRKSNITMDKIAHCLEWDFDAGNCTGSWEVNKTTDFSNFGQNDTHIWFEVNGFTAYAGTNGTNSNLTIFDQTDPEGGSNGAQTGDDINFTANYTKRVDGSSITGATCNIEFNIAPVGPASMTYNSDKAAYTYSRTYSDDGNTTWNVTCSQASFDTLAVADEIEITQAPDPTPPSVSQITPTSATSDIITNFQATVSDNIGVTSCGFYIDGELDGNMTINGSTANRTKAFSVSSDTAFSVYANCTDGAGNNAFNETNITVEILRLGNGGSSSGEASSKATSTSSDAPSGGSTYSNLEKGEYVSTKANGAYAEVKVQSIYPNSVRIDVAGIFNAVILEGISKEFDIDNDGVTDITVYVDEVSAYSDVTLTVVGTDGDTTTTTSSFFDLGSIWSSIVEKQQEQANEEEAQEVTEEQQEANNEEATQETQETQEESAEQALDAASVFNEVKSFFTNWKATGAVVTGETVTFMQTNILQSKQAVAGSLAIVLIIVLLPLAVGSFAFYRVQRRKVDALAQELHEEIDATGLDPNHNTEILEKHLEEIGAFIKKAAKQSSKQEVIDALLAQGWEEDVVSYALTVYWHKKTSKRKGQSKQRKTK